MDRLRDDQLAFSQKPLFLGQYSGNRVRRGGAPERIRTTNLLIRSQMLYPVELRAQIPNFQIYTVNPRTFCLLYSRCHFTLTLMKPCKTTKTWARTGHRNLLKHQQSGNYYARTFAGGKEIWKSLKTSHRSVAEARLAEFVKDHRKRLSSGGENSAEMTFDQAAKIDLQNLDDNPRLQTADTRLLAATSCRPDQKLEWAE